MAHDTLMSYWSRLSLKTCYHWAILAVFADDSVGLASWADVAVVVFFPPSSFSSVVSWRSLRRSAPEIGTLDRLAGLKTISTRINVSYDKTNRQAPGDSLSHPTARVLVNNNGDNLWVAGPSPCLGNCCSSTSGWRQHMAGKKKKSTISGNRLPLVRRSSAAIKVN